MESPILERSVRFESECVLIPEHLYSQKKQILSRPKIVSKSWSLPIGWSTAPNHPALASNTSLDDERDKERGRKLTVILPTFTKAKKAQPSPPPPLSPCLRKSERSNSLSVRSPTRGPAETLHRTASLPSGRPLPTVPLRPCCTACYEAVEAYLASPSTSPEKMSTGAMLRHASDHHRDHHRPGMLFPSPVKGCHKLSLVRVDEVDMKGSAGGAGADVGMECLKEENEPVQEPESDEEQLFPLPSPKRTPVSSPISSPTASQINLSLKTTLPTETSTSTLNSTTSPTTPKRSSPLCAPCVYPIPTPASPEIIGPDPDELPPQPHSHLHHSHHNNPHSSSSSSDRRSSISSSNASQANGDSPGTPGKRRRSSLSAFGESFSRGGAAILRGVGEVVNGVSGSGNSIMV